MAVPPRPQHLAQQIIQLVNDGCALMRALSKIMPQPWDQHHDVLHLVVQHYACWGTPEQSERLVAEVLGSMWEDQRAPLLTKALVVHLGAHGTDTQRVLLWLRAAIHADPEHKLPMPAFLALRAWAGRSKSLPTIVEVLNTCVAEHDPILKEIATPIMVGASREKSARSWCTLHKHSASVQPHWWTWTPEQWATQSKDILGRLCGRDGVPQRISKKLWREIINVLPLEQKEDLFIRVWMALDNGKITTWNQPENNHLRQSAHTHLTPNILQSVLGQITSREELRVSGFGMLFARHDRFKMAANIAAAISHRVRLDESAPSEVAFPEPDLRHAYQELQDWGEILFAPRRTTIMPPVPAAEKEKWDEMLACVERAVLLSAVPTTDQTRTNRKM